jgi:glucose-1-phosphate thymidylyltransferase
MNKINQGIILAGGYGTRLHPLTKVVNKHFLSIYDKPMIYYSLSILLLFKIENINIVCNPEDETNFINLLGDGSEFGININYKVQEQPEGIPHGIQKGLNKESQGDFIVILGDNFLHGREFFQQFYEKINKSSSVEIFTQEVKNPNEYGVAIYKDNKLIDIVEKPTKVLSNHAVIGLYKFNDEFTDLFKQLHKSNRGEFEIVDLLKKYNLSNIISNHVGRGTTWFDMGSFDNFFNSSLFVKTLQERQGLLISSPHEIAFNNNFINKQHLENYIKDNENSLYSASLKHLLTL